MMIQRADTLIIGLDPIGGEGGRGAWGARGAWGQRGGGGGGGGGASKASPHADLSPSLLFLQELVVVF